jgi:hypothetical protein
MKGRMNAVTAYLMRLLFRALNEASLNPSARYYIEKKNIEKGTISHFSYSRQ